MIKQDDKSIQGGKNLPLHRSVEMCDTFCTSHFRIVNRYYIKFALYFYKADTTDPIRIYFNDWKNFDFTSMVNLMDPIISPIHR